MKNFAPLLMVIGILSFYSLNAQVSINTTGNTPDASAMLEVTSTDKGVLIPRITTPQRNAISSPATGLLVFDTDTDSFWFKETVAWTELKNGNISSLVDADGDTKIQLEETADEDIIRFDVGGTERWLMNGTRLEPKNNGNSVFIGQGAGENDDLTDNWNVAIGDSALFSNTTGAVNTANGCRTLYSNTEGYGNTATGYMALNSNTNGNYNTADGTRALVSNTNGNYNTATGDWTLKSNTNGNYNTANGHQAMFSNTIGNNNTAYGYQSMSSNTTGSYNIALGALALTSVIDGDYNIGLGKYAGPSGSNSGISYTTSIGFQAMANASYTIMLGNVSVTTIGGYANWTNVSDKRFKTNIHENVRGLDFIMKLRPVTYNLDMDAIATHNKTPDSLRLSKSEQLKAAELQSGFIAQEVEEAALSVGYDFHGVDAPKNETSHYGLRYAEFVVPLVKAVQELAGQNDQLAEKLDGQQQMIQELKKEIENLKK